MKVVVAGASGLLGTPLVASFRDDGHQVVRLVRREKRADDESSWDPPSGTVDVDLIASADLVVNLAGASIGARRLTDSWAKVVLQSRLDATGTLARALADAGSGHLIQASAQGYYGTRGETQLHERARPGTGLLAGICVQWEAAANPAALAGVQVQWLRTGLVLAPNGGLARRLLPLVRLGLVRTLGSGEQWVSWITSRDFVRAVRYLAENDYSGPVNLVAPEPVRNRDLIAALARAAHRPRIFPVPGAILRLVVGPAADDILGSQKVAPTVLDRLGFTWDLADVDAAARWVWDNR